jgi:hypothetical protein
MITLPPMYLSPDKSDRGGRYEYGSMSLHTHPRIARALYLP